MSQADVITITDARARRAAKVETDSDLIRMCAAYVASTAEQCRLMEPYYDQVLFSYPPEAQARLAHLMFQCLELRERISATPARTAEGIKAKAHALLSLIDPGDEQAPNHNSDDSMAYSLARDLVGGVA